MTPEQEEAQRWLGELIYEISHLVPREDLGGGEVYRPIISCVTVDAAREALRAAVASARLKS